MNLSENKKVKSLFNYLFLFIIIGLGIYWRVHIYLSNIPLWWDEISLALSFFDRDIFGMFAYLECDQKAPPLFCVLVLIIKHFFANEQTSYALRLLPLLASIGSLFAFYFLLKDFYKSKFAILMSMWIFASSSVLIYYAQEFKPYGFDVLISIIILLLYKKISFKNLTVIKSLGYSVLFACFMLLSFPSMFIIPSLIIVKMFEEKCLTWKVLILPSGFFCSLIYLYLLYKERYVTEIAEEDWQLGFLNFSFESFRYMTSGLIEFFFGYYPERGFYVVLFLVVFMSGLFLLLLSKRKESFLLLLTSCLILLASFFRIYPITNRVALFILPFCILAIGKLIDVEDFEKKTEIVKSIVLSFFTILILQAYTIPFYGMNNIENYWMSINLRTSYKEVCEEMLSSMSNGDILYSQYSNYVFSKYYSFLNINKVDFTFYYIGDNNPINTLNIDELNNLLSKMDKSNKLYIVLAKEEYEGEYVPSEEVEKYLTQNKTYLYNVFENEFFKMYKIYKR